jgi:hypothetical protein
LENDLLRLLIEDNQWAHALAKNGAEDGFYSLASRGIPFFIAFPDVVGVGFEQGGSCSVFLVFPTIIFFNI